MIGGLLLALPLHYLERVAKGRSSWPRKYLAWAGRSAGLNVRIVGTPLSRHVLFVANHLSWLDIPLIAGASGAAFVSKDDVARWPVIGWLARLNDTIFIARQQRNMVRGQADALRTALAEGQPVALFPEGTTDGGETLLPFRPSLMAALFPPVPGLRVQPVAIDYGPAAREIAWVGQESAKDNAMRILSRRRPIPVTIHFLSPLDPHDFSDRKALAEASRAAILAILRINDAPAAPGSALAASARARDRL